MIEEYHFGSIIVNGKTYNYDIEVSWTPKNKSTGQASKILKWWRDESHTIDVKDIKRAIEQNPEVIIIGTGESGIAKVTEKAKEEIKSQGIKLMIDLTDEAVESFNILKKKKVKVIGLFHLTC